MKSNPCFPNELYFAPHHYLRDRINALLFVLDEKLNQAPEAITEEQRKLSLLCKLALWEDKAPAPAFLRELGMEELPLEENIAALKLLIRLEEAVFPKASPPFPTDLFPKEPLIRSFRPPKRLLSVGLKPFWLKKQCQALIYARSMGDYLLVSCGVSDQAQLTDPRECACEGKGFRAFEEYALAPEELTEERKNELLNYTLLKSKRKPKGALKRPVSLCVPWILLFSALLWTVLAGSLGGLCSLLFPATAPFTPFLPLFPALYGGLRAFLYALSVKR